MLDTEALAGVLIAHAGTSPILRKKRDMLLAGAEGSGKSAAEIDKRTSFTGHSWRAGERSTQGPCRMTMILAPGNIDRATVSPAPRQRETGCQRRRKSAHKRRIFVTGPLRSPLG